MKKEKEFKRYYPIDIRCDCCKGVFDDFSVKFYEIHRNGKREWTRTFPQSKKDAELSDTGKIIFPAQVVCAKCAEKMGHSNDRKGTGPRYRALGNSMCVNVMRWIGEGLEIVERHEREEKEWPQ